MKHNYNIELEAEIFNKLHALCKGSDEAIKEYIIQAIKHQISQEASSDSSGDKESLEDYLNQGQSGSRNYGVKGQGW